MAEQVRDTDRANYCDWFQAGASPHRRPQASREALDGLFAQTTPAPKPQESGRAALESLFGANTGATKTPD